MIDILPKALEAASYISSRINERPKIGVILGSKVSSFANEIKEDRIEIFYDEIPNFPKAKKEDFRNKLVLGKLYDKNVIIMQNKFHYYEGYEMDELTFPIKVLALLGVEQVIVTGSAGCIDKKIKPQDIVLIKDHINISGLSPIRGNNENEFGTAYPNMLNVYSKRLIDLAKNVASLKAFDDEFNWKAMRKVKDGYDMTIGLEEGIYSFMPGPQYETMAELKMLSLLGADMVGMSIVPEVVTAANMGMEILGLAYINKSANEKEMANSWEMFDDLSKLEEKFKTLIMRVIMKM